MEEFFSMPMPPHGRIGWSSADIERENRARRAWTEATREKTPPLYEDYVETMEPNTVVQLINRKLHLGDEEPSLFSWITFSGTAFSNKLIEFIVTKAWSNGHEVHLTMDGGDSFSMGVMLPYKSPLDDDDT